MFVLWAGCRQVHRAVDKWTRLQTFKKGCRQLLGVADGCGRLQTLVEGNGRLRSIPHR